MLQNDLQKIGLSPKEAKVYLAALELGEANIERISKKSKVKRTTVYDIVDSLKQQGLLSQSKKGRRTTFLAESPKKIEQNLKEKQSLLDRITPELLSIMNVLDNKPKIQFFEGLGGIKSIYEDTLQYKNDRQYAWWANDYSKIGQEYFETHYKPERIKNKTLLYVIANNNAFSKKRKALEAQQLRKSKLSEDLKLEVEIKMYGKHKTSIISYSESLGLIIESRAIHNTLKAIFEQQWNNIK